MNCVSSWFYCNPKHFGLVNYHAAPAVGLSLTHRLLSLLRTTFPIRECPMLQSHTMSHCGKPNSADGQKKFRTQQPHGSSHAAAEYFGQVQCTTEAKCAPFHFQVFCYFSTTSEQNIMSHRTGVPLFNSTWG